MSAPILNVNVTCEQWDEVRRMLINAEVDVHSAGMTARILGPRPAPPAPDYRVDRSDGRGMRVSCLAGDRVAIDGLPSELRSAEAIEVGQAIVAAGRYLQMHR